MGKLKAIGIESGIGSMLVGAKLEGFHVVGNVESRPQFHTGTFEYNFEGAFMERDIINLHRFDTSGIDLLMSHPSCGKFSSLGWANSTGKQDISKEQSTFPLVVKSIQDISPRFFLIDNLPRSLEATPLSWWAERLPDYRLNVEFVHNYAYGNVQLKRDRVFIMGWKKNLDFVFVPNEKLHNQEVRSVIGDLAEKEIKWINHVFYKDEFRAPNMCPLTIKEARDFLLNEPEGRNPKYTRDELGDIFYIQNHLLNNYDSKEIKTRIGTKKIRWAKHGQTVTSGVNLYHPLRGDPLTCRERARIMGFPDDFIFVFKKEADVFKQKPMGCQTGQGVPIGFPRYFSKLVNSYLSGVEVEKTGFRFVQNDTVEKSRMDYCSRFGVIKRECQVCPYRTRCNLK